MTSPERSAEAVPDRSAMPRAGQGRLIRIAILAAMSAGFPLARAAEPTPATPAADESVYAYKPGETIAIHKHLSDGFNNPYGVVNGAMCYQMGDFDYLLKLAETIKAYRGVTWEAEKR